VTELTPEQLAKVTTMKNMVPFRIVWAMIHKDTGEFSVWANYTRRAMNKAAREGHHVFQAGRK
jgi:hypothetical protein